MILTLDLAFYEVASSLWKHQYAIKDLKGGLPYLLLLYELVDSGVIRVVQSTVELMRKAYGLAARNRVSIYDAIFVSLALEIGLVLKTFDKQQSRIMQLEQQRQK